MMKKLIGYLGKIMSVLAIIYIIYYIITIDFDVSLVQDWKLFFVVAILGIIVLVACVFGMGITWSNILRGLTTQKVGRKKAVKVYVKANLGKYLPGNVMHYVERNLFAVNAGMGQAEITFSSILEIGIELVTAGLIAIIFLYRDLIDILRQLISSKYFFAVISIAIIMCIVLAVLVVKNSKIKALLTRMCSKRVIAIAIKNMIFYCLLFAFMGVLLVAILKYPLACDISFQMAGRIVASYILAWVIGFVVPGAPGGIGVREFILVTLLGIFFSKECIVLAMVAHRVFTVIGDVVAYLCAILLIKDNDGKLKK